MDSYGKYFTYKDKAGYYRCHELISYKQISNLVDGLKNLGFEYHATIQDYTKEGEVVGGYMYFDIDCIDVKTAMAKTFAFVNWLKFMFGENTTVNVWFSGRRGFHVMIPAYIKHKRWHEVMDEFCTKYNLYETYSVDRQVYRRKAMLRMAGSPNLKTGKRKTSVAIDMLAYTSDSLFQYLEVRDGENTSKMSGFSTELQDVLTECIADVEARPERQVQGEIPTEKQKLLPCLQAIWEQDDYPNGQRHQYTYILARAFRNAGYTEDEAYGMFESHDFFASYSVREWSKVVGSVYRSGRSGLGCRYGSDADLLKEYCDEFCHLNEDLADTILGDI